MIDPKFVAGFIVGIITYGLIMSITDALRQYLILRFPDNPYWEHNQIKEMVKNEKI